MSSSPGFPAQTVHPRRRSWRCSASSPHGSPRGWETTAICCSSPSRTGAAGDRELLAEGLRRLGRSAEGEVLTAWHIEAAIAARHATAPDFASTDWASIRELYEMLFRLRPTPVVALNRAIAVGMADGPEAGLRALSAIEDGGRLARYPFLPAAKAEFELSSGRASQAARWLQDAMRLARNPAEKALLARKLAACATRGTLRPHSAIGPASSCLLERRPLPRPSWRTPRLKVRRGPLRGEAALLAREGISASGSGARRGGRCCFRRHPLHSRSSRAA